MEQLQLEVTYGPELPTHVQETFDMPNRYVASGEIQRLTRKYLTLSYPSWLFLTHLFSTRAP